MNTADRPNTLVIGVGNANCGDDAVGILVARYVESLNPSDMTVKEASGEPMNLMALMKGRNEVILVDAIASISAPGTLHMLDASRDPLPAELFSHMSTHSFGLVESLELARALGELPRHLLVIGIEGERFHPGEEMSQSVARAIEKAGDWILRRSRKYTFSGPR